MSDITTQPPPPANAPAVSAEHVHDLAKQFVGCLTKPIGFRDASRAGMVLVYMWKAGMPAESRDQLTHDVMNVADSLAPATQRELAQGWNPIVW